MSNCPRGEFPRPERERKDWLSLNGEWDFMLFRDGQTGEDVFAENRASYDQRITVPFSWGCELSGVAADTAGIGWYRRRVSFSAAQRVFLCFGAVDYHTRVYVNGSFAGAHQGGYTYFEMDVTSLWQAGENLIEIRAEDKRAPYQASGKQRYGQVQGIWQPVWLEARPFDYLDDFIITALCDGSVSIDVTASAPDGKTVSARFNGQESVGILCQGHASIFMQINQPMLWSPDTPNLYEGTLTLDADTVHTYFGLREISAKDGKLLLNGKPLFLCGALDQGYNPQGFFTYPTENDLRDEVWRVKRLGLNAARVHLKPEEPRKLYWMDKLGVLVIEDMPCFWCPPTPEAQAPYEAEALSTIARDRNHPSIISWVLFNETWGLQSDGDNGEKVFLPEIQTYLEQLYYRIKALDPTRLIEDNSPCLYDHVITDINTWHFYYWGYEVVKKHIGEVCDNTYPGSSFNYVEGRTQNGAPLMNSECGMVWGVDGSAGDSDLAWQYHYMVNEFRLHEKLNGFIFTELRDVVNEFNGYYRIDLKDKDFGYGALCAGMTLRDMHAMDFVAIDAPPCQRVFPGSRVSLPLFLSSFSERPTGDGLTVRWILWHDGLDGRVEDEAGQMSVRAASGVSALPPVDVIMPNENALAVLSLWLTDGDGKELHRNFTTFDVRGPLPGGLIETPLASAKIEGFTPVRYVHDGEKLCLGGAGTVRFHIPVDQKIAALEVFIEAGAKRVLSHDKGLEKTAPSPADAARGYRTDREGYASSYLMTDETPFPSDLTVLAEGEIICRHTLKNDWADARGVLSWQAQRDPRRLEEAGSYGEQMHLTIPSRLLPGIMEKGGFELALRTDEGGLALYGRGSGRYPHGILTRLTPL